MTIETYRNIIANKTKSFEHAGITHDCDLPSSLFDHQRVGVEFALRAGRSAMFYDTGLGKTAMALSGIRTSHCL